jgi:prenyltransferase beta subunit
MLRAANRARLVLGDSTALVSGFIGRQLNEDGGFKGRSGQSDLYYTVFGVEALLALGVEFDRARIATYLRQFGDGDSLDLVHLACLARCWADISKPRNAGIEAPLRDSILRRLEGYRCPDGGYSNSSGAQRGTAYGCFLALGAYQDLNGDMDNVTALARRGGLADCVESLRTPDGAYSNDPTIRIGATPATAAALTILHYLNEPVSDVSIEWLLSQRHPKGGFVPWHGLPAREITARPVPSEAFPEPSRRVEGMAVPHDGSFGMPDLLSTATALHALALAGVSLDSVSEKCLDFLDSLWSTEGAFRGSWADPTLDCEYTYYGLLSLGHLCAKQT